MQERQEFRKALQDLIGFAAANGGCITRDDVEEYLGLSALPEERCEMVYQYLAAQNIKIEGMTGEGENPFAEPEKNIEELTEELSEDDRLFLEEYMETAEGGMPGMDEDYPMYMKLCAQIALEYAGRGIPLADIIQEGNVGLLMAFGSLGLKDDTVSKDEYIREGIRGTIEAFLEEEADLKASDDRMLEKINYIAEAIRNLSEDLERKVSLEELSAYLEMTEEEVTEILKLTGEEFEAKEAEETDEDSVGFAGINDFKVF